MFLIFSLVPGLKLKLLRNSIKPDRKADDLIPK